jgi:nucleotide-binding universal stress UspA family protein
MKNVLLLVHDDAGQEARLQAALDLTREISGHLYCLGVTPVSLLADGSFAAPAVVLDETEQEAKNKVRLQQRLIDEDVTWTWTDVIGDFDECLCEAAGTADVVVLNRKLRSRARPHMVSLAGEVLRRSQAIVLAVDELTRRFDAAAPALVAWDGSKPAMNALRRAVPLLTLSCQVSVFQGGALPWAAIPAEEAAAYLSRHGITSDVEIGPTNRRVAEHIEDAADRVGAGYCVAGAHGHSRLSEAVFGSVTKELLSRSAIPLLMGH